MGAIKNWANGHQVPNWQALLAVVLVAGAGTGAVVYQTTQDGKKEDAKTPSLTITSPDPDEANQTLGGAVTLKGTASDLPPGQMVWPFDAGVSGSAVWPHLGPCPVDDEGNWECPPFTFGEPQDAGKPFTLSVTIVSDAQAQSIADHLISGDPQHPTPMGGSKPPGDDQQKVVVNKGDAPT